MNRFKLLFAFVFLALFCACKKEKDEEVKLGPFTPPTKEIFTQCNCGSKDSGQYINGFFNGTYLCFNSAQNAVGSRYVDTRYGIDDIDLKRQSSNDSLWCRISFIKADPYDNKTLPYDLPHPNLVGCERAELDLIKIYPPPITVCSKCDFSNWDDWNYYTGTDAGLRVTVTDTANGFITGSFEGKAFTDHSRRELDITDGTFHIHLDSVTMIH